MLRALAASLVCIAVVGPVDACEQNPPGWVGAMDGSLCNRADRIALPDTSASVRIPNGYECSSGSTTSFENTEAHVIECLPHGGGSALELQQEIGSKIPKSLRQYLTDLLDRILSDGKVHTVLAPHNVRIADRAAVESALSGEAFFDGPGWGSRGELLTHAFEIEDPSGYYTCSVTMTPMQNTKNLRKRLHDFCDSITF